MRTDRPAAGEAPADIPRRINVAEHFLGDRVRQGDGGRVALRLPDGDRTYAEADALASRFGAALLGMDVRAEERVLIALPDGEAFVAALFGALRVGAVVVMINPALPAAHLSTVVGYSRARVAVVDGASADATRRAAEDAGRTLRLLDVSTETLPDGDGLAPADTHRDDPALWLFSGGTTGAPKAVVQTHRSFVNTTACYAHGVIGYRPDDITLSVPRLYFGYATGSNLLFPFSVGASAALYPDHPTAEVVFDQITRHRPTILVNVPKMIAEMVDHPAASQQDLSCLRLATSAGEALPPSLHERWTRTFGVELLDGLGTAEMWHIFCSNRPGEVRPGTLGRAVPGFDVRVRDLDGRDVPDGEVGRLWVRGDSRALGYWQDLDKTAAAFRGEWFVGGDMVSRDADGFITYAGRADDALKVGGKWLLPAELEDCLLEHPRVQACAVVGVPDEQGLTKPVAFVVAADGGGGLEETLKEHALARLDAYKHPRRVIVVDDLPRTHLGKVDRGALRALL